MLPPIDEAVLKQNPDFDRLYKTLTGSLLNPDGSTRSNDPAAKKRDAVHNQQQQQQQQQLVPNQTPGRARTAPLRLILHLNYNYHNNNTYPNLIDERDQDLKHRHKYLHKPRLRPPKFLTYSSYCRPSSRILPLYRPPALALLLSRPPFSHLPSLFPVLTATISTTLSRQAGSLARVLNPHTNPSYIHRSVPALASTTTALLSTISSSSLALSHARQRAAYDLASHLSQHAAILAQLVRVLESKHGPAARSAELRAEEANLSVRAWALAAEALLWDARRAVYPPEARRALTNYKRHLGDARMRLADTLRVRQAELEDYGVIPTEKRGQCGEQSSKERTMREMARVWREMESRLNEVKGDLDRLR
ncbi:hypothetical protein Daesc_002912 [Daldinia eschscholtzii]|uniref:Uncharacterized protein n=1 Tax=Daldinia eschscholtzii TaxID=292717 RepID=A0AAX6MRM7_9PEZI